MTWQTQIHYAQAEKFLAEERDVLLAISGSMAGRNLSGDMKHGIRSSTDLAIQEQQIETKQADFNLNILHFDVFTLSATELLEGK